MIVIASILTISTAHDDEPVPGRMRTCVGGQSMLLRFIDTPTQGHVFPRLLSTSRRVLGSLFLLLLTMLCCLGLEHRERFHFVVLLMELVVADNKGCRAIKAKI